MINHCLARHKSRVTLTTLAILLISLTQLAACGGGSDEKSPPSVDSEQTHCSARVDLSGWEAFVAFGEKAIAEEDITLEDLTEFGSHPVISLWRESMTERVPSAEKVGRWAEAAFWDELANGRPQKLSPDRGSFGHAMRFSFDHRAEINPLLEEFQTGDALCEFDRMARRWIEADKLAPELVVRFVAAKPELRSHLGQLVADTGILLAGGPEQTSRQLVAILYRDRQALQGPSPLEIDGAEAVAQIFRILLNEGIASWIEQMPETHFSQVHPRLGKVSFIPENIFTIGIRGMDIFNTNLPGMLADPEAMARQGKGLGRAITGAGAFTQGGFCMAAVIAHHLGEDRLLAVRKSPAAFVASYQEAASMNRLPLPVPGALGSELPETMPTFSDEVFTGIMALLQEYFPES